MDKIERIVDAALSLAAREPWPAITLSRIAAEAGFGLDDFVGEAHSKAAIVAAYVRRIDRRLLASLREDPAEGGPHDRLFDVMLRRLEMMAADKPAVASILAGPGAGASECAELFAAGYESQGWTLAAAGFAPQGFRADVIRLGLARIQAQILRVWLEDDDPGLARTMAALDRLLRDAEDLYQRIERPIGIAMSLYRGFRAARRKTDAPPPRPEDEPAYATAD